VIRRTRITPRNGELLRVEVVPVVFRRLGKESSSAPRRNIAPPLSDQGFFVLFILFTDWNKVIRRIIITPRVLGS